MTTLQSIKTDMPLVSLLSSEQVLFVKGGEDKREPRPSNARTIDPNTGGNCDTRASKKGKRG